MSTHGVPKGYCRSVKLRGRRRSNTRSHCLPFVGVPSVRNKLFGLYDTPCNIRIAPENKFLTAGHIKTFEVNCNSHMAALYELEPPPNISNTEKTRGQGLRVSTAVNRRDATARNDPDKRWSSPQQ